MFSAEPADDFLTFLDLVLACDGSTADADAEDTLESLRGEVAHAFGARSALTVALSPHTSKEHAMAHADLVPYSAMRSILAGLGFAPDGSSSSPSGAHLLVYGKAPGGAFAVAYLPTRKRGRAWVETYTREGGPSGYVYRVTRDAIGEWVAT